MSLMDVLTKPKHKETSFADIVSSNYDVVLPPNSSTPKSPVTPEDFITDDASPDFTYWQEAVYADAVKQLKAVSGAMHATAEALKAIDLYSPYLSQRDTRDTTDDTVRPEWAPHVIVNKATAIRMLAEVAAVHPGKYETAGTSAHYFTETGEGSCILGVIFHRLGFSRGDLAEHLSVTGEVLKTEFSRAYNAGGISPSGGGIYPAGMRMTRAAAAVFSDAQYLNDTGKSWSFIAERAAAK